MATSAKKMIEVQHLKKYYHKGKIKALDDVSVDINQGDVMVVIGPSGSGKSTFLRSLNLLEVPTEGSIIFEGVDITKKKVPDASGKLVKLDLDKHRQRMGMVFQHFNLFPHKTVLENLTIAPMQVKKMPKEQAEAKAMALLERVGLADRAGTYPIQLSGGQKQRVAIARALATKPRYLLCDEATSALDPNTTQSILSLLKEINKTLGVTIVVITHEMRVIDQICDRVAVIDQSRIAESGKVSDVFTSPQSRIARELILPGSQSSVETVSGGRKIRLIFNGERAERPVIANMILACQVHASILAADTRLIEGKTYGYTVLALPDDPRQFDRVIAWLNENHNTYRMEE